MSLYCWKCRKNTKSKNPKVLTTKNRNNNTFIKLGSVRFAVKNQNLSKSKKLEDY